MPKGRRFRAMQNTAEARKFTVARLLSMQGRKFSVQKTAEKLNVSMGTIHRDIRELMEEWKNERIMLVEYDRQRMASQLEQLMKECRTRLNQLKSRPNTGSRWVEMEIKAIDRMCRLYGLYAPQAIAVDDRREFTKEERDAVIDAVIQSEMYKQKMIDVTPRDDNELSDAG